MVAYNFFIFLQFLRRDFYTRFKQFKNYLINYSIIYPILHAGTLGYLASYTLFDHPSAQLATILFAGSSLFVLLDITFEATFGLLFDLETDRFIDYQLSLLNPRLVILEHIVFATLFAFVLLAPFFGITTILLHNFFDFSNASWLQVYIILLLSCFVCSSYQQLGALMIKNSHRIVQYWVRVNIPLTLLGGLWTPYGVIKQYSPTLGYVMLVNPLTYITEGLRQALVGGPMFMPFWFCSCMLIILSIICIVATFWFFKKRVDHI